MSNGQLGRGHLWVTPPTPESCRQMPHPQSGEGAPQPTASVLVPWWHGPESTALSPSVWTDRKSTRLNSSHANISYAVFCLKIDKELCGHFLRFARRRGGVPLLVSSALR